MNKQEKKDPLIVNNLNFVFNHAIRYFNMFVAHSRYIIEIFFRMGLFLLIDVNPFNTWLVIILSSLSVSIIIFTINQRIKKSQAAERESELPEILLPKNIKAHLEKILKSLKASQSKERNYINYVNIFLDINMLSTFCFYLLHTYFIISQKVILLTLALSLITRITVHKLYFAKSMEEEDNDLLTHVQTICEKAKETDSDENAFSPKEESNFFLLLVDALFYTGILISFLILLPTNISEILITSAMPYLWAIGIPMIISIALGLYASPEFKNSCYAFISTFTTTSTLSIMGFKYLYLFPIINQVLFLRIGPLMLFKSACVYVGVLTGLVSYRIFNRNDEITTLLSYQIKPDTDCQNRMNGDRILPRDEDPNHAKKR
jgi:hypothetical protein